MTLEEQAETLETYPGVKSAWVEGDTVHVRLHEQHLARGWESELYFYMDFGIKRTYENFYAHWANGVIGVEAAKSYGQNHGAACRVEPKYNSPVYGQPGIKDKFYRMCLGGGYWTQVIGAALNSRNVIELYTLMLHFAKQWDGNNSYNFISDYAGMWNYNKLPEKPDDIGGASGKTRAFEGSEEFLGD